MELTLTAYTLAVTAFTTGLLGSVHCLSMCGGISGTLALGAVPVPTGTTAAAFPIRVVSASAASTPIGNVLAFNIGRVASYMVAGTIAGSVGGALSLTWSAGEANTTRIAFFMFANLMVIATGLYLMGVTQLLAPLERMGGLLWRYLSPLTKTLLPLNTLPRAAAFGALWGWIPCGMVYAMLLSAVGAGGPFAGMLTMLAFGLGTLPMMLAAGWAAASVARFMRNPRLRMVAGALVIMLGLLGFARVDGLAHLQTFGQFCISLATPASNPPHVLPP